MRKKALATLCAAACMVSAIFSMKPTDVYAEPDEGAPADASAKVDLSTVTAAVPEDYAAYYNFDGNLTDAVSGQSGNTVGRLYNLDADSEEASYEEGVNGQAVAFYGFGDGAKLPVAPSSPQYTVSADWYIKGLNSCSPGLFIANVTEDGVVYGADEDAQWISISPLGWHTPENLANGPMVWSRNVPGGAPWNDLFQENNNSLALEKWINITVAADGANATIYVDGTPVANGPIADIVGENTVLYLGVNAWDAPFNGNMDNLYIYNRTLSAEEVAGLAKASLTPDPIDVSSVEPAVAEGYSSYYKFDGNLTDEVTGQSGNTVGRLYNLDADSEDASYEESISGQAVAFYGFGDGVKLPTAPKSKQYTVSVNWYVKGLNSCSPGLFIANVTEDGVVYGADEDAQWISIAPLGWHTPENVANGPMVWSRNVPGEASWNDLFKEGNNSLSTDKWLNVTVVADGAVGTIYVDGVSIATGPIADIIGENTVMYLGVNAWDAPFNGNMDNLYIYDRCLSDVEVAALAKASLTETSAPAPTDEPSAAPTEEPSAAPTDEPSAAPTDEPSKAPEKTTDAPTPAPEEKSGSNTGLIVVIVVVVIAAGAAAAAVVLKKKGGSKK